METHLGERDTVVRAVGRRVTVQPASRTRWDRAIFQYKFLESIGQAGRLHEVGNRVDRLTDLYERVAHALGAIRRDLSA